MKKRVFGLVIVAAVACLVGVMGARAEEPKAAPAKSLVVYYSWSGKTELAAKTLAESLKADLLPIEDVSKPTKEQAYGPGRADSVAGKAWPIKPIKTDLAGYDRLFVGCPVWFSMPPPEFNAFVEQTNLTNKQVVVFVTYGGGGQDAAIKAMTGKVEGRGGKVVSSFTIKTGKASAEDIKSKAQEAARPYMPVEPVKP